MDWTAFLYSALFVTSGHPKRFTLLYFDIISIHKVRKQFNSPCDAPYAQELDLGWVIVGNVCELFTNPPQ